MFDVLLAALVGSWHDFFVLIGTASATLVGLMFVAVSITAGYMTEELRPGLSVFLSPTILHLASILVICLAALLPTNDAGIGALVVAIGVAGFAYAVRATIGVERFLRDPDSRIDREDRFFYGALPPACQLFVIVGATLVMRGAPSGPWVLATALVALLLLCIRNAWDITVWAVIRRQDAP